MLNSCPEPTGPAVGHPWALKLHEPLPRPPPRRQPGLPPSHAPPWVPPSGCTRPFSMPSWTPIRLHVSARLPLA